MRSTSPNAASPPRGPRGRRPGRESIAFGVREQPRARRDVAAQDCDRRAAQPDHVDRPADVPGDFATLGADVLATKQSEEDQWKPERQFVLTRLHARYDKTSLGEDLVFKAAPAIVGGREFLTDGNALEQGSSPDSMNNFQARYAIRHPWTGPIECSDPQRGVWGGPPLGMRGAEPRAAKSVLSSPAHWAVVSATIC